ncbi:MAG: YrhK family protein [Roseovarius sp.]|nr:YrhK family protein [Roseovarius sp.]
MAIFRHENRQRSERTQRIYAAYEIARTCVDFLAALCFLVGSALFFWPDIETRAIWLFVVGSAFFCLKPTIKLAREIHLWRYGDLDTLARRSDR